MEVIGDSLDALLFELYQSLLADGGQNEGSRGANIEELGVALRLTKPRARLSRSENRGKPFSALGELLWYLSGSEQLAFIQPYVKAYEEDAREGVLHGAYGPRLFAMRGRVNQIENVVRVLTEKPGSRRAVIQLFNAEDIEKRFPEIPCTTTLQFHIRNKELHLSVTMRSNDAFWGLPHDVFCFTMLQEMMARRLGVNLGQYYHYVGSMHIYDKYISKAKEYVEEGFQRSVEMPTMPDGNPFQLVPDLIDFENATRGGKTLSADDKFPMSYWADIGRLIQVFWAGGSGEHLDVLRDQFTDQIYLPFIEGRRGIKSPADPANLSV